ncbi:hypothetical protein ACIRP2_12400 [Streptomyces sp. NPDC101194]|uniref:hypothetical protein n=1 Tax=Streptomyces sp. NPDC101194 TaxID=3366127 RepID=UPI0037F6067B
MADPAPATPVLVAFLDGEAEGLCDPATGVCAVPTTPATDAAPGENPGTAAPSDGETAGLPASG